MKELTIEENAKVYTELINRLEDVKDAIKKQNYGIAMDILYKPYPEFQITTSTELKESEDEKIRKGIRSLLEHYKDTGAIVCPYPFVSIDECIAWLEKQGKHANFLYKIQVGDKVTRNEDGVLVNLSQLNRVTKKDEKQGEQKPAEFLSAQEAMDIAVEKCFKTPEESLGVNSDTYNKIVDDCVYGEQKPNPCDGCVNRKGCINCENGELREVEQKPADKVEPKFKVGDEIKTANEESLIITKIDEKGYWSEDLFICGFNEECIWDLVEQKPVEWRPIDNEYMTKLCEIIDGYDAERQWKGAIKDWLKSLKDRVHPQQKQEWSEEDESMLKLILTDYRTRGAKEDSDIISWLKSLRPQKQWKPTEEQMDTLEHYMHTLICNKHKEILFGLYVDLKKLKE